MPKKHHKFAGFAQHEIYLPTTGCSHKNRRNRKLCDFYFPKSKLCKITGRTCVGPTICKRYKPLENNNKESLLGLEFVDPARGKGKIVYISDDICTIQFANIKVQCKYKKF